MFDNFQDEQISDFKTVLVLHGKTCWTENMWFSGIMSNFWKGQKKVLKFV